jgi:hypothetical protein
MAKAEGAAKIDDFITAEKKKSEGQGRNVTLETTKICFLFSFSENQRILPSAICLSGTCGVSFIQAV